MQPASTGVVGAGLMGRDIAGLLANGGFPVTLVDIDADALESAREYHRSSLRGALAASHIETADEPLATLDYASDLAALADCEFVVEAVPERLDLKRSLVDDLEAVLDAEAIIATNTSSLTPSDIAVGADRPERVVLFHFANPAIERDVVEIAGDHASDDALDTARAVATAIGHEPIRLEAEHRANCLSRLSASIKCAGTWELRRAEAAAIDRGATAVGFERGPLEFIDLIGIDVHLATVDNLAGAYGERYAPPTELRSRMETMVEADSLGMKTGQGFFEWEDGTCLVPEVDEPHDVTPIVAALVNEAHRLVADGVGEPSTIDDVLKRGSGGSIGPFDIESMLGADALREALERRYAETGAGVFDPVF
ncbi:3-hydroxyacyl-CoA dehydrogenase [Halococcus agarilyticus]|uniref:3-hydroxyacyl-CoA dehydrogenase n=1 Tax=Halococcus agarilyticus TaxID=1232219 RepID=UPI0006779BFA|nr:3-hydroxyacyl-CoA dehydrogenase [Halococcus agarilyticus]